MNVRPVLSAMGMQGGYPSGLEKAIVTLKEDSKGIEFFESMM